jgi:thermitase
MKLQQFILHIVALMFCAWLPMTPIMAAAVENAKPGYLAEISDASSLYKSDVLALSHESMRWDLLKIQAQYAWPLVSGGEDVLIAVLDTGIDDSIEALKGKVVERMNFSGSPDFDQRGHGTFVAGLIAATADNALCPGLAYNARLLDIKVAKDDGSTDAGKVARGVIWAANHGAEVINISVVINEPYPLLEFAVDYAWKKGCVIVAAAGNGASFTPVYPAKYANVLAVAASDKYDDLARWSNRGDWVDVDAPGVDIYSTLPGNKYGIKNGSSFSAALVSGEAALLFTRTKDLNNDSFANDEVYQTILNNCDVSRGGQSEIKRINVYNAARAADIIRGILETTRMPD